MCPYALDGDYPCTPRPHLSHWSIQIKEPRMMPQSIKASIKPGRPRPINKRPLEHVRLEVVQTPKRIVIPEETFTHLPRR